MARLSLASLAVAALPVLLLLLLSSLAPFAAANPAHPAASRYDPESDPEPMSPAEVAVALSAAMSGLLSPAAVERLTVALSRAPGDQIPPGIREEVYLMHQGVNRSYVAARTRARAEKER